MSGFTHPEYLVETDWLAQNLSNPSVLVLDCTTHLIPDPTSTYQVKPGREDFEIGHIPGAQFVDMLRDEMPRIGHGGARIAFLDPASTGNVLIELAELPA